MFIKSKKNAEIPNNLWTWNLLIQKPYLRMCVLLFFFCLYICVCVCLHFQYPLRKCRSIRSGASRLPYDWASLACFPDVLGLLTVWWDNKPKTKNQIGKKYYEGLQWLKSIPHRRCLTAPKKLTLRLLGSVITEYTAIPVGIVNNQSCSHCWISGLRSSGFSSIQIKRFSPR